MTGKLKHETIYQLLRACPAVPLATDGSAPPGFRLWWGRRR
jgi:hypothetical protein